MHWLLSIWLNEKYQLISMSQLSTLGKVPLNLEGVGSLMLFSPLLGLVGLGVFLPGFGLGLLSSDSLSSELSFSGSLGSLGSWSLGFLSFLCWFSFFNLA